MNNYHINLIDELNNIYKNVDENILIPPPVFQKMKGEVIYFNKLNKVMKIRFPVLSEYLNPYGNMQGGMLAAAIDNTFGPLSMLIGIKNYTRKLEIKYKKPVTIDSGFIQVEANVQDLSMKKIILTATVTNTSGDVLALSKSINWIIGVSCSY